MGPQFNEGEIAITTNTKFSENRGSGGVLFFGSGFCGHMSFKF